MKKVVVLGTAGAEDIELVTILDVLRRGGLKVTLVSVDCHDAFQCANGTVITGDSNCLPDSPASFDALVLPGGSGAARIFSKNSGTQALIKASKSSGKLVAAICASPMALAMAGVLSGLSATIYPSMEDHLTKGGARPSKDKVVVDQNVVTSQGPGTAIPFALKLVELLVDKATSDKVKEALVY